MTEGVDTERIAGEVYSAKQLLEEIGDIAERHEFVDLRNGRTKSGLQKAAVRSARQSLEDAGYQGVKPKLKELQWLYVLAYLDVQEARTGGGYDPVKPLMSEAGRRFRIFDSAVDEMCLEPTAPWQMRINGDLEERVNAINADAEVKVLEARKAETILDIPEESRKKVEEAIKELAGKAMADLRGKIEANPSRYTQNILSPKGSSF